MATSKPVRKAAASKVGVATQAAGVVSAADAMPRSGKLFGADPKRIVGYGKPAKAAAPSARRAGVKTVAQKVAATEKTVAVPRGKVMAAVSNPRLGQPVATKTAKVKAAAVKYKGIVIPVKRKNSGDESDVPTIQVKNVTETMKVFALLPKGCTWMTEVNASTADELNVYNASGALIVQLRTDIK